MVDHKPLQEWLQKHGIHTLNPAALQSLSRRLAVEGATTNELDLLWNHAIATGAEKPAGLIGIALKDNWRLAVESVLIAQPEHLPDPPEEPAQYPGDVPTRSPAPENTFCTLCDAPGVRKGAGKGVIICSECKRILVDAAGNMTDAGQRNGGK